MTPREAERRALGAGEARRRHPAGPRMAGERREAEIGDRAERLAEACRRRRLAPAPRQRGPGSALSRMR